MSEKIRYVGVNDYNTRLFEGLWPLPYGVSYNSYLIIDEKIALIDTVDRNFEDEYMDKIRKEIGGKPVDYLIINHMEPDHSSLITLIREEYPEIVIVCNSKTVPMLRGYHKGIKDGIKVIGEGETLSLGKTTMQFFMAPMVHWPETMVTYLKEEKTLFSGDAFGTFGAIDLDSKDRFEHFKDEMIRYYSNIVGKYGTPVQSALKKLAGLEISRICSTHGPVWEARIPDVMSLYDKMSRYEAEPGVCIVYGSMYGNTAKAANALAEELKERGIPYAIHDLAGNNGQGDGLSGALRDAFRYDTIAVGSPTYNNDIFPPVASFMRALQSRLIKNRRFYAFGSYTWAGSSVNLLKAMAQEMKFDIIQAEGTFAQAYDAGKLDMSTVAEIIKNKSR